MASGGILTTVGPSLIVWKVGPLLLNQINTLCTHTHRQYIYRQHPPSAAAAAAVCQGYFLLGRNKQLEFDLK